jgi:mono/diheme cytochrome c family protein
MAKIDWKTMDKKHRKEYMKKTVTPEMKKIFLEADAKKYKKMNCVTCHGDGATKGDFKMPNPQLPKLPTTEAGFKVLSEKKPDVMKFMATRVKPNMAALLGLPEWTPQNQNGFGCYQCHTKEAEAAAPAPAAPAAPAAAPAPKPAK